MAGVGFRVGQLGMETIEDGGEGQMGGWAVVPDKEIINKETICHLSWVLSKG